MISGLFIVGLGFSLQQTAANPLAIIMGDPKTGSQRLSLAGGVNNFGTTIGPLLVSFAIFGTVAVGTKGVASIESIKTPYLILGIAFLVVAAIFKFSSLPNKIDLDAIAAEEAAAGGGKAVDKGGPLKYPQLALGMLGIFVYVGVEVSTASNLPEFMKEHVATADGLPFPTENIAPFVSLYWASLMIGRWTSSVGAFGVKPGLKKILNFIMPYLAFGVFLLVNKIAKHDITPFYIYVFVIIFMIIGTLLSSWKSRTTIIDIFRNGHRCTFYWYVIPWYDQCICIYQCRAVLFKPFGRAFSHWQSPVWASILMKEPVS